MIALTESRKLELIEECKIDMRQSSPDGDIYPIYEIALTSLTAVTVNPADCFEPVYLCPPVPEIKLPNELNDLVNAVEFYNKVKAENPTIETGAWNDAYDWIKKAAIKAAPVIKRLNGLGE